MTTVGDDKVQYQLLRLPKILVIQVKRFVKNSYFMDKNPSLVVTPIDDTVDFGPCSLS